MLGGWDLLQPDFAQPLNEGPVYERLNGKWVEKCPMETNFKAEDIIFIDTINGNIKEPSTTTATTTTTATASTLFTTAPTTSTTTTTAVSYKNCEVIYDYVDLLLQGTSKEEMKKKLPCTIKKSRKAYWEFQHFKLGKTKLQLIAYLLRLIETPFVFRMS